MLNIYSTDYIITAADMDIIKLEQLSNSNDAKYWQALSNKVNFLGLTITNTD